MSVRMWWVVLVFALACGLLTGCEQGAETLGTGLEDVEGSTDADAGGDMPAPEVGEPDSPSAPDLPLSEVAETTSDVGSIEDCPEGTGCFGESCNENSDCLSELCVPHMGEMVCSRSCEANCPVGWLCQAVTSPDVDVSFVCVSSHAHLCLPCGENSDCGEALGSSAVCVDGGGAGSFCGAGCGDESPCPSGYLCEAVTHTGGGTSAQCVPDGAECSCSSHAVDLGMGTPCYSETDFGECSGVRVCSVGGLTFCDAQDATEEICDGVDNDCDGDVDEVGCDDGNPCTEDACGGSEGCVFTPLTGGECLDGDPCTSADHCDDGACVGAPVLCDDGNPCTDDACDGLGGCAFEPNALDCDDDDPCTAGDVCDIEGTCVGIDLGCECVTSADCAAYDDPDACNGTLGCDTSSLPFRCEIDPVTVVVCDAPEPGADAICQQSWCDPATGGCSIEPDHEGLACEDGAICTVGEVCTSGACVWGVLVNCADGEPCTDDACEAGLGCTHTANALACEDGDPCTVGDVCSGGGCTAGPLPFDCDDGNVCTQDGCESSGGCVHAPIGGPCDDGNACTTGDACVSGACAWMGVQLCHDGNPCTDDACHPSTGCVFTSVAAACDDGDPCTLGDQCLEGACGAGPIDADCDDGNPCTDDACDAGVGCVYTPNGDPCEDGDPCTLQDLCAGGACGAGDGAPNCDDGNLCTDDACEAGIGCVQTPNGTPCDDSDACTQGDTCSDGACASGAPVVCDDQNGCTEDLCDATSGCAANPNTEPCDDGDACTVQDACAEGSCQGTPAACDDGIACTVDSCDPGPGCVNTPQDGDCDDGLPCTDGVCHAGQGCAQNPVENCCGNGIVEGAEVCDDNNTVDGDGCSAACDSEACYDDWLVGSPCNGTNYGNGCDPDLTGYHYRGHFGGWECWWHTRNQAWNTSSASNHYNLAMEFGLTPSQGWCSWCHDWTSTPSGMSEGGCGYLGSGNSGAWGWCAESQHWDGGWICFPSGGLPACANASQWP